MKKTILLSVFVCLCFENLFGQWTYATSLSSGAGGIADVAFPAEDAAYICGNTYVYKSTDGGLTWDTVLTQGPFVNFTNLHFINADTGFVSRYGTIVRTFDGGENWTAITGNHNQPIKTTGNTLYASFVRNDTVYVVKSKDFGNSWISIFQHYESNARPFLFDFIDTLNGYFINPNQLEQVLKTTNGCASFDTINITNGAITLQKYYDFIDMEHGYLYGSWGAQSHPTRTWNTGSFYFPINLDGFGVLPVLDLCYIDGTLYASTLYGKVFYSQNNGEIWTEQQLPTQEPIYSIAFLDENQGIAITENKVYYTNNGGQTGITTNKLASLAVFIFPNPANGVIHIKYKNLHIQSLKLTDLSGRLIKTFPSESKTLNVSGVAAGLYFLQAEAEEGKMAEKVEIR